MDVTRRVAVIGAGLIGRSWAIVFAGGGCDVALYDASAGVATEACALVAEGLARLAEQGLTADAKAAHARVRVCPDLPSALEGASLGPIFTTGTRLQPEWFFWEQYGNEAVRHGNW